MIDPQVAAEGNFCKSVQARPYQLLGQLSVIFVKMHAKTGIFSLTISICKFLEIFLGNLSLDTDSRIIWTFCRVHTTNEDFPNERRLGR